MIFSFIRYTQPVWKFNLLPVAPKFAACLYHPIILPLSEDIDIQPDERYQTEAAQNADIAYRAWNKGCLIEATEQQAMQIKSLGKPSLKDEYIFIKKYWGLPWVLFALLLRIFTFKNIFKELTAFFSSAGIKRINPYSHPVAVNGYKEFSSKLILSNPLVAVIIPTLNRYEYLQDVLDDLQKQTYKNFEVLVYDQSDDFDKLFYEQFSLNLKVHIQKEKLLWTARNNAVKATDAEHLLFFDDDSRVQPNWIAEHLKCLDFFKADISAGVSLAAIGGKVPESYNYFRWADQFDSGNALVKRSVFESIGLFDEQFNGMRMGDGEFGLRAYMHGFKSISNYKATRVHLKVSTGGLRELGSWDGFRPIKWVAPKPIPSVVYLYKKYFPKSLKNNAILIGVILSNIPYKYKRSNRLLAVSIVLSVIKSPLLFIQYYRSCIIAEKMLNNPGSAIEILHKKS